jgi:arylsulfatase A-like enzyme
VAHTLTTTYAPPLLLGDHHPRFLDWATFQAYHLSLDTQPSGTNQGTSLNQQRKCSRRNFLGTTLAATTALSTLVANASRPAERPNVLVILSDDQGYADAGFQGSSDLRTPNLDRVARAGLRCTNGYVSHPFCSPSRAGLLTGRYQARFGHEHNPHFNPNDHREGLPTTENLLPEFLQQAGYATGWIGKWHLGSAPEFHPQKRGFQDTFGFIGGGHHYLNWQVKPEAEYNVPICRSGDPVEVKEHLTVAFGHEAAAFIRRHKHGPLEPTAERLARFTHIPNLTRRKYAAQISLMDDAIGEALDALRRSGQEKRTLVFFFSDNGAPPPFQDIGASNGPLRGYKGDVYEGGIHVPFLVSWPARLPAGKDYDFPVSTLDVFATALACAGLLMPSDKPYDGVNLIPYLSGEKSGRPRERLFWRTDFYLQAAVRDRDMKLVRDKMQFERPNDQWHWKAVDKPDQLFDLAADLGEKQNRAGIDAPTMARLEGELDAWFSQMAPHLAFPGDHGPEREWPKRKTTP